MNRPLLPSSWIPAVLLALVLLAGGGVDAQTVSLPSLPALHGHAALTTSRLLAPAADERRPERLEFRTWAEADWEKDSLITRTYDGAILERETYSRWEGGVSGDWVETGYAVYSYFEGGLISSRTQYTLTPTGPVGVDRDLYSYEGTVVSEVIGQVMVDGAWVNDYRTQFAVTDGQIVGWQDSVWDGIAWAPEERSTLVEAEGDVVQTTEVRVGSTWEFSTRTIYPDRTIAQLIEELEEFALTLTEYEGLLFGLRLPTSTSQEWDGEAWVNAERTLRETMYDVFSGHIIDQKITTETWVEGVWVPATRFHHTYDRIEGSFDAPVPAMTSFQVFDGEGWADFMVEAYLVPNDVGRIVQATTQMDFGAGLENVSQVLIDWKALSTGNEPGDVVAFSLAPNVPNPFTDGTIIAYTLVSAQPLRLTVFDGLGREVAVLMDGEQPAGEHRVRWEPSGLPAGVYLYRLEAGGQAQTRQALLVR